jgi:MoxR-like ATPase
MQNEQLKKLTAQIIAKQPSISALNDALSKKFIGQEEIVQQVVIALLCNGHLLLEGVPGLGKTLLAKAIAQAFDCSYKRVQFTPDLLPADIVGTLIFNPATGAFSTKKGPVFTNILLADEINRAPAKVQSALLEAMEEKQVTLGDETHFLPIPFFVLATQNPLEQHGTYPLPEAQLDRFFMKLTIGYPTINTEKELLINETSNIAFSKTNTKVAITTKELLECQSLIKDIYIDEKVATYIMKIVQKTRENGNVFMHGISPRGSINLALASKAIAFLNERAYVIPDDVKDAFTPVNRHRVMLQYEALSDGLTTDHALKNIINQIAI